ncbi:DJ-1/PfpI family protein [Cytophagaceae bacterium ABcell3]|nr:DJ-1/PfpI family protein [Cytophagaceae bacterium ABcell3]
MKVAVVISTVGFHWEELYDAYKEFQKSGSEINFYTVNGHQPKGDPKSLEKNEVMSTFGLGLSESFSPDTEIGKEIVNKFSQVQPVGNMNTDETDIIYLPGGHGCLFDVNIDRELHQKILEAYQKGKLLSAVCHGTSTFGFVNDGSKPIVADKKMTGFPEKLDNILLKAGWVHEKFVPIPYSNEDKMKKSGAKVSNFNFLRSLFTPGHTEVDYPFVTGVGPKAAENVAKKTLKLAEKRLQKAQA